MADTSDYYGLLGVSRSASNDDIRKAYRRLARELHPDVNGGDSESTERFKAINKAYEVLSNPEKRTRYDRFGPEAAEQNGGGADFGGGFATGGFGDLFEMFFGATGGQERGPNSGDDLRADVDVTLQEVLTGVQKTVSVNRLEHCPDCTGTGSKPGSKPQKCVVCAGQGYVRASRSTLFGTMSQVQQCYRCEGRGELISDPCARCRGKGVERQGKKITVDIPAGVESRMRMRVNGQGDSAPFGGAPGDLYVFINVKQDPRFRVSERDIISEIDVSFARAALGGAVEVPTLEGPERLSIPKGTQPGDVFRLRGKGLPQINRPQVRGDQNVVIRVHVPKNLNERQKKALADFAEASGENLDQAEQGNQGGGLFEWARNLFSRDENDERS